MLSIEQLEVELGGARILRGVNLAVPAGCTIGLAGRNGAGKTTTLRAVMGLIRSRGRMVLGGQPIERLSAPERARRAIGYAPEDRRLIASLTVAENLRLPAEATGAARMAIAARLAMILDLLPELVPLAARPAGLLSGGQQKMVALGRALMTGHRLLLLDEPFQGLAPALARRYAAALGQLRAAHPELAVLITESNSALLAPLVSTLHTIERGEIVPSAGAT